MAIHGYNGKNIRHRSDHRNGRSPEPSCCLSILMVVSKRVTDRRSMAGRAPKTLWDYSQLTRRPGVLQRAVMRRPDRRAPRERVARRRKRFARAAAGHAALAGHA